MHEIRAKSVTFNLKNKKRILTALFCPIIYNKFKALLPSDKKEYIYIIKKKTFNKSLCMSANIFI